MKKYLLPQGGQFYKANLHSHSTISDGRLTPQEMKELYQSMGYSIIAYTDHNKLVGHSDLNDETFLALHGYEMDVQPGIEMCVDAHGKADIFHSSACHFCLIALEQDNLNQVPWYSAEGNPIAKDEREYTPECINETMRQCREQGFFVTYNHPTWSGESYEQYMNYHHMHAMEICNYISVVEGNEEYNPRVFDDMLRGGKKIYCIGTDDNHNIFGDDSNQRDYGGAWIMIKAKKLEYRTITRALEEGEFYASQGPEIQDIWVEDGYIHVTTSEAASIRFIFGDRRFNSRRAKQGETINYASTQLYPYAGYVRITVEDYRGRFANSNAYYIHDLLEPEDYEKEQFPVIQSIPHFHTKQEK